jgi:hypothetical protein
MHANEHAFFGPGLGRHPNALRRDIDVTSPKGGWYQKPLWQNDSLISGLPDIDVVLDKGNRNGFRH